VNIYALTAYTSTCKITDTNTRDLKTNL